MSTPITPEEVKLYDEIHRELERERRLAASTGSPLPWKLHRTGSTLGIKAADKRFVVNKVVSQMEIPDYERLLADFNTIIKAVNK